MVVGLLVASHWLLDFIVHPHELPLLFQGSPTVGLGLWTSGTGLAVSVAIELALLAAGLVLYIPFAVRRAKRRRTAA